MCELQNDDLSSPASEMRFVWVVFLLLLENNK